MHSMLHFFLFLLLVEQSLAMPTHVNMLHKRFDRFCGDKDARQGNDCPNGHNYEFVPKLSGSKVKMHVTKGPKPTGFNCDHTIELQWLVQMTNKALEEETSPLCEGLLANDQKLYKQLAAIINDKSNLWNIPKNMNQVKKWYWTNPEITSTTWPRLGGVQQKTKARTLRGLLSYQTQVKPKMQRNVRKMARLIAKVPNSGIDSSTWPQEFDAYISRMTKQVRKDIDHLDPCDDNVQGSSSTRTVRRWIGSILGAREADGASQAGERQCKSTASSSTTRSSSGTALLHHSSSSAVSSHTHSSSRSANSSSSDEVSSSTTRSRTRHSSSSTRSLSHSSYFLSGFSSSSHNPSSSKPKPTTSSSHRSSRSSAPSSSTLSSGSLSRSSLSSFALPSSSGTKLSSARYASTAHASNSSPSSRTNASSSASHEPASKSGFITSSPSSHLSSPTSSTPSPSSSSPSSSTASRSPSLHYSSTPSTPSHVSSKGHSFSLQTPTKATSRKSKPAQDHNKDGKGDTRTKKP